VSKELNCTCGLQLQQIDSNRIWPPSDFSNSKSQKKNGIQLRLFELSNIVIIAVFFFSKIRTNETIVKRKQNKNEENVVGNGIVASITET